MKTFLFYLALVTYFATGLAAEYDPVAVYLTWQRNPDTTMTISWLTPKDRPSDIVEYRREDTEGWLSAEGGHVALPDEVPYFIHRIELVGLKPSTDYLFRTGEEGRIFKFQTMPSTLDKPINFVAGGDMYHDEISLVTETNRQAAATSPSFALVGGDIAYADAKLSLLPDWMIKIMRLTPKQKFKRWLDWLIAWKNDMVTPEGRLIPMLPVLGNHDVNGEYGQTPQQAPFFYAFFAMPGPQGYNVLDFSNYMTLILMDSNHTHPIKGAQTQWLANTLQARQGFPHKFALYHVPAYPSSRSFKNERSKEIRKYWIPLFDQYQLTAAFENHDHAYKRTFPLTNGEKSSKGVLYFGDGSWSVKKLRKPGTKRPYLAASAQSRHFLSIKVEPGKRTVAAITPQGNLIDQYSW